MSIIISLSPEIEDKLREKEIKKGKDVRVVATQLLSQVLEWELQDSTEAIKGIQSGLDDLTVGRSRSFEQFATQQRHKHNLSVDS